MNFEVWAGILLGLLLIVCIFGWREKKRLWENCQRRLQKEYGQPLAFKNDPLRMESIPAYYRAHDDGKGIDDITWNDLGMDQIFAMMNYTYSASGEEYLYYTLRTPVDREEELMVREQEIAYFMEHEKERRSLQTIFMRMGKKDRYSLYDYLEFLREAYGKKKTGPFVWMPLFLVICSVALLFVKTGAGLLMLVGVIAYNIFRYFNQKGKLRPYLSSLRHLVRMISACRAVGQIDLEVCREQISEIRKITETFLPFLKKARFVFASETGSGNPLEILRDYINMVFHFDLIQLNGMLSMIERREEEIDRLNTALGYLETMIAAGSYRTFLKQNEGYCIPEFLSADTKMTGGGIISGDKIDKLVSEERIMAGSKTASEGGAKSSGILQNVTSGYHPMLQHPVRNSYQLRGPMLLTGSNASGKSTFLKTMALNQLFAQTLHMACAEQFRTRFYRICSSMSLTDDLRGGDSYFMVEIKAMKRIIEMSATEGAPVLCMIDEVLRGTNTVERIAASTQILKSLAEQGVVCVAATHDIELTMLLEQWYENYHFTEIVDGQDITFDYRLLKGRADSRNAIRLLQVMGYDAGLVEDAEAMAQEFIRSGQWRIRR